MRGTKEQHSEITLQVAKQPEEMKPVHKLHVDLKKKNHNKPKTQPKNSKRPMPETKQQAGGYLGWFIFIYKCSSRWLAMFHQYSCLSNLKAVTNSLPSVPRSYLGYSIFLENNSHCNLSPCQIAKKGNSCKCKTRKAAWLSKTREQRFLHHG